MHYFQCNCMITGHLASECEVSFIIASIVQSQIGQCGNEDAQKHPLLCNFSFILFFF